MLGQLRRRRGRHDDASTCSNGDSRNRVLVADGVPRVVPLRDSETADGSVVLVGASAWVEFVRGTVG
ncbi:DUF397 domain-containing protein [Streptomyces sp. SID161]|uniref:DUF397 domain-containing protein n=1 Tax=Streptomyces sp. SID161 TaxID=2690251 RepID=UPI0031FE78F9